MDSPTSDLDAGYITPSKYFPLRHFLSMFLSSKLTRRISQSFTAHSLPVEKSSKMQTSWFLSCAFFAKCDPIYPAPPVTKIFIRYPLIMGNIVGKHYTANCVKRFQNSLCSAFDVTYACCPILALHFLLSFWREKKSALLSVKNLRTFSKYVLSDDTLFFIFIRLKLVDIYFLSFRYYQIRSCKHTIFRKWLNLRFARFSEKFFLSAFSW